MDGAVARQLSDRRHRRQGDYATLAAYRGARLLDTTESPESDVHRVHLVAIVPGEYPTPAISLAFDGEPSIKCGELTVAVKVNKPPPNAILAQMITRPCLVVGFADPRVDPFGSSTTRRVRSAN